MPDSRPQILFATDFSDGSAPAAQVALQHVRRVGGRLHVLHVTRVGWEAEMLGVLRDHVQRIGDVPVTAAVETGTAADRIVAYADRNAIELIVLGAHGRSGFTPACLGSVAERVARTAHCPVMTVPRESGASVRAPEAAVAAAPPALPVLCLVCHAPSTPSICDACRARIRDEAVALSAPDSLRRA